MTEQEQKDAIRALRAHHTAGTAAPWSLAKARPVAVYGACYEFEFVSPNGIPRFILDADGIPRAVNDPASLARALGVARGWGWVHRERRLKAERQKRKRKVK